MCDALGYILYILNWLTLMQLSFLFALVQTYRNPDIVNKNHIDNKSLFGGSDV